MYVELSPDWCAKCAAYGQLIVEWYKNREAGRAAGAAVKSGKDLYADPNAQAEARAGEVAVCIALGFDPMVALKWDDQPDGGIDLRIMKWTADVKTSTHWNARYLIWPKTKLDKLSTAADILLLVKLTIMDNGFAEAEILGWEWSKIFRMKCKWASGVRGIVDGTPYLDKGDLRPIEDIIMHLAVSAAN